MIGSATGLRGIHVFGALSLHLRVQPAKAKDGTQFQSHKRLHRGDRKAECKTRKPPNFAGLVLRVCYIDFMIKGVGGLIGMSR